MIYIKSNEHNITNNYNDKVKMIFRSRLEANIKYVVTTLYSAIKTGFLDKIDNVSGSNVIKKVLDKGFGVKSYWPDNNNNNNNTTIISMAP